MIVVEQHNIRMDLEEIGINVGNCVDSTQDRNYCRALVNAALNLRVPYTMELVSLFVFFMILSAILMPSASIWDRRQPTVVTNFIAVDL